jgi:hypothetical protein
MKEREGAYAATEASNDGAVKAWEKSCGITLWNSTVHAHIKCSSRENKWDNPGACLHDEW